MDTPAHSPGSRASRPVTERIALLDVLRGFAVFGILLFNIMPLSGWILLNSEQSAALPGGAADSVLEHALVALVEGKFYSLFSLLFGIGFAVIARRADAMDGRVTPVLVRRYVVLLAIGLIHSFLIWFGDILVLYALLGFALLACNGFRDRTLIRVAVTLLLLPIPLYALGLALQPPTSGESGGLPPAIIAAVQAFKSGTYSQIVAANVTITGFGWLRRLILMFYPRVFAMFLLGLVLGRMGVFQAPEKHAALFRMFARCGLLIGLPASIAYSALNQHGGLLPLTNSGLIRTACESIGTPMLCLGYVAWIATVFQTKRGQRLLLWLAPVGRMALSNYLLHSVIGVLLFYGIGAGLYMEVSLATALGIAFAIYALQILISRAYFRLFHQGPVETLWRRLTYGRRTGPALAQSRAA